MVIVIGKQLSADLINEYSNLLTEYYPSKSTRSRPSLYLWSFGCMTCLFGEVAKELRNPQESLGQCDVRSSVIVALSESLNVSAIVSPTRVHHLGFGTQLVTLL